MEIELHDLINDVFEAKPIYSINDLESDEEMAAFFPPMIRRTTTEQQLCSDSIANKVMWIGDKLCRNRRL
jgi:hypothetical protein